MLCEYADHFQLNRLSEVLILVLMEYALRDSEKVATKWDKMVLILVLMEYALRESQ